MKFKWKKWQIAIAIVVIILFITNPSGSDFKSMGHEGCEKANFLIFSTYQEYSSHNLGQTKTSYLGIFKNFFETDSEYQQAEIKEWK